jgi:hypothetical protein
VPRYKVLGISRAAFHQSRVIYHRPLGPFLIGLFLDSLRIDARLHQRQQFAGAALSISERPDIHVADSYPAVTLATVHSHPALRDIDPLGLARQYAKSWDAGVPVELRFLSSTLYIFGSCPCPEDGLIRYELERIVEGQDDTAHVIDILPFAPV